MKGSIAIDRSSKDLILTGEKHRCELVSSPLSKHIKNSCNTKNTEIRASLVPYSSHPNNREPWSDLIQTEALSISLKSECLPAVMVYKSEFIDNTFQKLNSAEDQSLFKNYGQNHTETTNRSPRDNIKLF